MKSQREGRRGGGHRPRERGGKARGHPEDGTIEIVSIGDELIEGRLIDTNAGWMSDRLNARGLIVSRHTTVGDEVARIAAVLGESSARAGSVVVSGGLGPTGDDVTAEAVAEAFGLRLVRFEEALDHARAMFARIGRGMPANNEKQAWLPDGCVLIPNPRGTACGFFLDRGSTRFYFMPGVPHELEHMFERDVVPDLERRHRPRARRILPLVLFGLGESAVASRLEDLEADPPMPLALQYRAAFPEIHLRVCLLGDESGAGGADADVVEGVGPAVESLKALLRERLGTAIVSEDGRSVPEVVVAELIRRGESVAVAESCTGGLLAGHVTDVPGASAVFPGGVVAYANAIKTRRLGVSADLIDSHGAVSAEVARAMAAGAREHFEATWALSTTGIAGPGGGSAEKPVGTVYIGLAGPRALRARRVFFPGDRQRVRVYSVYSALDELRRCLLEIERG